jgi:ribose transport system substrate-binding protein
VLQKRKVRFLSLVVGVIGVALLAAGIAFAMSSAAPKPPPFAPLLPTKPGSGKGLKIGYISLGESIAYIHVVTQGIQKNAKIAGATVIVCDSKLDAALALDCARNFKTEGVNGILNFQVHEDASAKICAAGPKVPVIAIDINQKPCEISFLGVSNYGTGFIVGQGGGEKFKKKFACKYDEMFIVGETASGTVIKQRRSGMRAGFESVCGPAHNVRLLLGENTAEKARALTTDGLTAVPSPKKVIMLSTNGDMTIGALSAIKSSGRANDAHIIGFGIDLSQMCPLMKNPSWLGDALLFPEHYGPVAVQNIIKAIKGQAIPKTLYIKSVFASVESIPKYYPQLKKCVPKS